MRRASICTCIRICIRTSLSALPRFHVRCHRPCRAFAPTCRRYRCWRRSSSARARASRRRGLLRQRLRPVRVGPLCRGARPMDGGDARVAGAPARHEVTSSPPAVLTDGRRGDLAQASRSARQSLRPRALPPHSRSRTRSGQKRSIAMCRYETLQPISSRSLRHSMPDSSRIGPSSSSSP